MATKKMKSEDEEVDMDQEEEEDEEADDEDAAGGLRGFSRARLLPRKRKTRRRSCSAKMTILKGRVMGAMLLGKRREQVVMRMMKEKMMIMTAMMMTTCQGDACITYTEAAATRSSSVRHDFISISISRARVPNLGSV